MKVNKHAYLIIAHNQFEQLAFLVSLLDYTYHDIFILIDGKADFSSEWECKLKSTVSKSSIFFVERRKIYWGGYSQIEAELDLFEVATSKGDYSYYHLISGSDLPLASNEDIYIFFEQNQNKIFLSLVDDSIALNNKVEERLKYYHFFSDISSRTFSNKILRKLLSGYRYLEKHIQSWLGIDLLKKYSLKVGYASNWVSLDKESISRILAEKDFIQRAFRYSILGDEIFLPTMLLKLDMMGKIYFSEKIQDKPEDFQGNLRYINWWDGSPHTWTSSKWDLDQLLNAKSKGHLFSRKFDLAKYPEVVSFIQELHKK
ncbi:Core-2/I-Branching enzyme [[Pasteurella] aerogenes]|nr:Core-2/I-Branching enzyme [[Pasteurella] aerogenes]